MRPMAKAAIATIAFAALHSGLAAMASKRTAAALVCERRRDAGYRTFFIAQSLLSFAALTAWTARLPRQTLYCVRGPLAGVLRLGQLAGLAVLLAGARESGIAQLSGGANLAAFRRGERIPAGPAAQGPEMRENGTLACGGPYRWSRHPLNFAALPVIWLTPRLTTRRLGFNLVASVYFFLGSIHEEARLERTYGDAYRTYRARVPFFLGLRERRPVTEADSVIERGDERLSQGPSER